MSRISEIFGKVAKTLKSSPDKVYPKLTPNEVELNSFKERDRLDDVKQQLIKMRTKHSMLSQKGDINIEKKQPSLLTGNTLLKKQNHILKDTSPTRRETILDAKNVFW